VGATQRVGGLQETIRGELKGLVAERPALVAKGIMEVVREPDGSVTATLIIAGVAAGLTVAVVLAVRVLRLQGSRRRPGLYTELPGDARREIVETYRHCLRWLARRGYPARRDDRSPREYSVELSGAGLALPLAFVRLSALASDALYSGRPLQPATAREAKALMREVKSTPSTSRVRPRSWKAHRVSPVRPGERPPHRRCP